MISLTNSNHRDWPYPREYDQEEKVNADILVLGGGIAGCWAAISAAQKGVSVVLVEKGATIRSGAGGSGCDHWEAAATNPCSKVSPEELTQAKIKDHSGYNNGISRYIESREGYHRLLDLEKMGAKIRDTDDEFVGAPFRDEKTKFLFAYDYKNRFDLRVWGTTFKPALYKKCKQLGVTIYDRVMATNLLAEKGKQGERVTGAVGVNGRTGKFYIFLAKATILCLSRPARIWLFSPGFPGISEFRPPQCIGDGHAMGWHAGVEFTMMEKSKQAEWSGTRSFPPYSTGNTHNTWYACTMVDAKGRELPWVDRDGNILTDISQRYMPSKGQKFFLKGGGESDFPLYQFKGPDLMPVDQLLKKGFELPFYADLSKMPELERKAIWGLMIGEEAKTKVPILQAFTEAGFDPCQHLLQSYGDGWRSGSYLPQERQLFGVPGGVVNDWKMQTNLEGLFAAGDQLFAGNCHGHAAATGHYAGRHAAHYAKSAVKSMMNSGQVKEFKEKTYLPLKNQGDLGWQELNMSIARIMQHYCGSLKSDEILKTGLQLLSRLKNDEAKKVSAKNPHQLIRTLEVLNILTNAEMIIHACLARKASSKHLHFKRLDYPEMDPPDWHKFITIKYKKDKITIGKLPINYYDSLKDNYEKHNRDYIKGYQK